jgi:hypothetical protein
MAAGNKIVASVPVVCAATARVHADMMPVCLANSGRLPVAAFDRADVHGARFAGPWDVLAIAGPETDPVAFLPGVNSRTPLDAQTQVPQVLSDDQGSLDLCLYALFGLGLCRSVPLVRRLSFGCIPDWYHHGGPFQIGHSYVTGPDCLRCVVACSAQPGCPMRDIVPRCHTGPIAALLRQSLFTPNILASRGPPRT